MSDKKPVPTDRSGSGRRVDESERALRIARAQERRRAIPERGALAVPIEDPSDVVRASEITADEAADVWAEALKLWGYSGESSERERSLVKEKFALAILEATSGDDENLDTKFYIDGVEHSVRVIYDAMLSLSKAKPNPLRVFVNSYENAYFALVCMDTLSDPSSVEARQALALRTGGPVEHAPYMFDCAGAAVRKSGRVFSASEINMIRLYKSARTGGLGSAEDSHGTPLNDNSTRMRREYVAASVNAPPAQVQPSRIQFAKVS